MLRKAPIEQTRNLGILAHIDAGKTTTTERILFYSGVSERIGEVDDGTAMTDWLPEESNRGISINSAAITFEWNDYHLNLIDTPGHVDFTIEVERSLRVLDGAVTVLCAVGGVESQTETVWRQANRYNVPRIAFINKCDRVGADPEAVTNQMRDRLRANPIVLQLPKALEGNFNGLVDLVDWRFRVWDEDAYGVVIHDEEVPEDLREEAQLARELMLEALAEADDEFMAKYLAREGDVSPTEIRSALRRATLDLRAVPVLLGSALKNKGVQPVLDAVIDFLPGPADLPPAQGVHPDTGEEVERAPSADEPLSALAFKVMSHSVGQLTYVRVYSGTLRTGDQVVIANRGTKLRVGRLVRVHASEYETVDGLACGDIGAAVRLRNTKTGDTICDPAKPVALSRMEFPEPVIGVAIEPTTAEDSIRLSEGLEQLSTEDPTFCSRVDPDSSQTIVSGMGELHLEVLMDRLAREFGVKAIVGTPEVAYRSGVRGKGSASVRIDRRGAGGRGFFAGVDVTVEPLPRGEGLRFEQKAPVEQIPKEFTSAVEAGIREAMDRGAFGGYPLADTLVVVHGGAVHAVDSTDSSFKVAALQAFQEACADGGQVLLEPVMEVEVHTPDEYVGDVVGDLNARRGKITGIEARPLVQVVTCSVPLAGMFGYATDLRSRTQGRATYSMQFLKYAEVPQGIAGDIAHN